MCISTAYENNEDGPILAEHVAVVTQQSGSVIMTDIMGKETAIRGFLKLADLTHGVLVIEPEAA
jgi:predicted RNA-binding protein